MSRKFCLVLLLLACEKHIDSGDSETPPQPTPRPTPTVEAAHAEDPCIALRACSAAYVAAQFSNDVETDASSMIERAYGHPRDAYACRSQIEALARSLQFHQLTVPSACQGQIRPRLPVEESERCLALSLADGAVAVVLDGPRPLYRRIFVAANIDTAFEVQLTHGAVQADDSQGFDPVIDVELPAGTTEMRVWRYIPTADEIADGVAMPDASAAIMLCVTDDLHASTEGRAPR